MKIVFSRKGFDSATGQVASPILPSGELCWLPIPESQPDSRSRRYTEIMMADYSLGTIVNDLTKGKLRPETPAHLDPDLNFDSIPRPENWQPLFGQAGAAERHLQNQGVKQGDVFVFFGWFRQVEQVNGKYRYAFDAPDLHVIFGWLQIEQRLSVDNLLSIPLWASNHLHCKQEKYSSIDSIYMATDRLNLPNAVVDKPGAGRFKRFNPALCLTTPGKSRSVWQLPNWFHPNGKKSTLSYHHSLKRWTLENDYVLLNSVGRGQEFVLDCKEYPESVDWLCSLLKLCG